MTTNWIWKGNELIRCNLDHESFYFFIAFVGDQRKNSADGSVCSYRLAVDNNVGQSNL